MQKKHTYLIVAGLAGMAILVGAYKVRAQHAVLLADTRVIHHVGLNASIADPDNLLIQVGEYVEFDSKDGKMHNIASGVGNGDDEKHDHSQEGVDSGDFGPDEGYLVQFKKVGTFYFHDHRNPNINASIGVYDPLLK